MSQGEPRAVKLACSPARMPPRSHLPSLLQNEAFLLFEAHPSWSPGGAGVLTDEFGVGDTHFQTITGFTEDNRTSVGEFLHVRRH